MTRKCGRISSLHTTQQERLLIIVLVVVIMIGSAITIQRRSRGIILNPDAPTQRTDQEPSDSEDTVPDPLVVHVTGAVVTGGVYVLPPDSRVMDAVEAAGGLTPESDPQRINLAAYISDGQQIFVPYLSVSDGDDFNSSGKLPENRPASSAGIGINTASRSELEQLPGIGPVLAGRIVDYRETHGPFSEVDDLLNVNGIGPQKLEDIRGHVSLY